MSNDNFGLKSTHTKEKLWYQRWACLFCLCMGVQSNHMTIWQQSSNSSHIGCLRCSERGMSNKKRRCPAWKKWGMNIINRNKSYDIVKPWCHFAIRSTFLPLDLTVIIFYMNIIKWWRPSLYDFHCYKSVGNIQKRFTLPW